MDSILMDLDPYCIINEHVVNSTGTIELTPKHAKDPFSGDWTDTYQLNWWNPALLKKWIIPQIQKVAAVCDVIRVDMAHLIINEVFNRTWGNLLRTQGYEMPTDEVWKEVLAAAKTINHDIEFIAEAYEYNWIEGGELRHLRHLGFDYVYQKTPLDILIHNKDNAALCMREWLSHQSIEELKRGCHFIENHDEERAMAAFESPERAFMAASIIASLPGICLINYGQMEGFQRRLPVQMWKTIEETPNMSFYKKMENLLQIVSNSRAISTGNWELINLDTSISDDQWSPGHLLAWSWSLIDVVCIIVINTRGKKTSARVPLILPDCDMITQILIKELITDQEWERDLEEIKRENGLYVEIPPNEIHIMEYLI
eukprot:TRINITY_DN3971_c0_g2_i2.p1 TRINITY_DN3971_c0_g2~~TRINITY_DN3971_c0_g2_i2.p1  ORF type:complete len:371 (+),score=77.58 TRINITY_DN3971_c0_g2_i2:260-1372(+)